MLLPVLKAKPAQQSTVAVRTTTKQLETHFTAKCGYDIASCNILMIIKIIFHRKNSVILHSRGKTILELALVADQVGELIR